MRYRDALKKAKNKLTTSDVLIYLAEHADANVRACVAGHHNTPEATLVKLASDISYQVQWVVAQNENTPIKILAQLLKHGSYWIRQVVVSNPSLMAVQQLYDYHNGYANMTFLEFVDALCP